MEDRYFGKEISNDFTNLINNMKKNISMIREIVMKADYENKEKIKGGNKVKILNYKGKENKPLIFNKVKNDENLPNNNNQKQENIKHKISANILSVKNKLNIFKSEERKNPIDEYDDVIMKNLFIDEVKNRPNYTYYKLIFTEKDFLNRFTSINFIISISESFEFKQETIYLSLNLYDRCYQKFKSNYKHINIEVFTLSCIFVSSKYEEIYPPLLEDYCESCIFSREEIFELENFILDTVNFELHICSSYLFLTKFFYSNSKNEKKEILYLAQLILDLSILSIEFCQLKPSHQAVICLYLSKYILYKNKSGTKLWTKDDEFMTGYSESKITANVKFSIKKIKAFSDGSLARGLQKTGIFKKYNSYKYLGVAKRFIDKF